MREKSKKVKNTDIGLIPIFVGLFPLYFFISNTVKGVLFKIQKLNNIEMKQKLQFLLFSIFVLIAWQLNAGTTEGLIPADRESVADCEFGMPDGGIVSTTDDRTFVSGVYQSDQVIINAKTTSEATELSYWYIITDADDKILDWVNANEMRDNATVDLSGAPDGECHVWGWSYKGLPNPGIGDHITSLMDDDCEAISSNWITVTRVKPDGGRVYTTSDMEVVNGVAGTDQLSFNVKTSSTADSISYWYIITDADNNILDWVNANSNRNDATVDLSSAPAGECRIWGWSYRGLSDPVVGENISTLNDDPLEAISENWVTVNRIVPDGGRVYTTDDKDFVNGVYTTDQVQFSAKTSSTADGLSYWYIITDADDNILTWVNANEMRDNATIDLSGAPAGVCHVWGWSYRGLSDPVVGEHISTLDDDEREDISENWITVTRAVPDGGKVYTTNDKDYVNGVAGTDQLSFTVKTSSMADSLSYWYIITDADDKILTWVNANGNRDNATVDLSGAPAGVCHVWGWSYRGLGDPVVGEHISTLAGNVREDISDNWITVTREMPDGGRVYTTDDKDEVIGAAGNMELIFNAKTSSTADSISYWYIITDADDNILTWVNANDNRDNAAIDLSGAPAGVCHVWGWSYRGLGDPVVGENISTLDDDPREDISENWITVYRNDPTVPNGGRVYTTDNTDKVVAVAGTADLSFTVKTSSTGDDISYWYIITDADDNILTWVNANDMRDNATVDLSGAPAGVCHVWGWSYSGLADPVVGQNISTLNDDAGSEEISENWITVYRNDPATPHGGRVYTTDGKDYVNGVAGTDQLAFNAMTSSTGINISYWYIITDADNNILTWVNANNMRDNAAIDLSGAPAGECRVWGWSYSGLADPVVGENISTLNDDTGSEEISENWITVNRITPDGGRIYTVDDKDYVNGVYGSDQLVFNAKTSSTADGLSYWYIITDADDNILTWVNANDMRDNATIDLSGAPAGVCHVWGWSYRGLGDPVVGENISTLDDDPREDISENWITVRRIEPDGGRVYTVDDKDYVNGVYGSDQLVFNAKTSSTADGLSYWYIITDADDNILTWVNANDSRDNAVIDLSVAPAGVCHVWGWSYRGLGDPVVGEHISTLDDSPLEDISENWITVTREAPDGGRVYTVDDKDFVNGVFGTDQVVFNAKTSSTADSISYWYIVTDADDNILKWVPANNNRDNAVIDLSDAPAGVCHIWGWSYRGLDDPIAGEHISTLDDDPREDISENWITVTRVAPDGGRVYTIDDKDFVNGVFGTDQVSVTVKTSSIADSISYWYIVTDADDNILKWVPASDNRDNAVVDLSDTPAGVCHIWGWSYRGLDDPIVGEHISTLRSNKREDISENWITVTRVMPDGGRVYTTDDKNFVNGVFGTDQVVFNAKTSSTADSLSYWYIVTDADDNILKWVPANDSRDNAVIDLSDAPAGVCHIWGWSYRGLDDPIVGEHISTLDDDPREDISENWITVTRVAPDGGRVYTTDDKDFVSGVFATDQVVFNAKTSSTADSLSYWYIVTDADDNILKWVPANDSRDNAVIDLSDAPAGVCHIWGWSYRGLDDPIVGEHISTLDDDPREDISENWITVTRVAPDGGMVSTVDGETTVTGVVGSTDLAFNVTTTSTADSISYWYVITDADDNILTWVNANDTRENAAIDLSAVPAGECHIWGWSYRGLSDPVVGENISTLDDDPREDISENWITVIRDIPTSIDEEFENSISVYPVPANDLLHISGISIESVRIISTEGKVISVPESFETINISDLPTGVYLLDITSRNGANIRKRVIKK